MTRIFGRNLSTLPRTGYPRSGSVLILVIVLLLLLAILGTAYLTTSAGDRSASAQTVINAQVDENSKAIANAVTGMIVNDMTDFAGLDTNNSGGFIFGQPKSVDGTLYYPTFEGITNYQYTYRGAYSATQNYFLGDVVSYPVTPNVQPYYWLCINTASAITPAPPTVNASYPPTPASANWRLISPPNVTSGWTTNWLADRIPVPDGSGTPYWQNITQLFVPGTLITNGNSNAVFNNLPFESPDGVPWTAPALWTSNSYADHPAQGFYPGFKALNGTLVPTLGIGGTSNVIAADADGDGIADSYLFRIPGATFDNLTWYAGVRIIDDNSAINANTAISRNSEYSTANPYSSLGAGTNWGLSPSDVGLVEISATSAPAAPRIPLPTIDYQFSSLAPPVALGITNPFDEVMPGGVVTPIQRADFSFISLEDATNNQIGRRLLNPAFTVTGSRGKIFPYSDTAALAYRFVLVNPRTQASVALANPSAIESTLYNDLYNNNFIPNSPYDGVSFNKTLADWFGNNASNPMNHGNFNGGNAFPENSSYPTVTNTVNGPSLRPYLVTHNSVSNYIAPVYDNFTPAALTLTDYPLGVSQSGGVVGDPIYTTPLGEFNYPAPQVDPFGAMMLPYGQYQITTAANAVTKASHYRGAYNSALPYFYNDIVLQNRYTYICINTTAAGVTGQDPSALTNGVLTNSQNWQLQPWSAQPTKANVNTATFRELFRAYWSVMSGNPGRSTTSSYNTSTGTIGAPLSAFGDIDSSNANIDNIYAPPAASALVSHMFRSPLRDPTSAVGTATVTRLDSGNVALLRAAIAAVNTLGLRDNTQNIISRTVGLTAFLQGTPTTVHARVFSSVPEPFITEIIADNYTGDFHEVATHDPDYASHPNPNGYIAVELFNPYTMPIYMHQWQIGLINRNSTSSGYPNLKFDTTYSITIPDVAVPPQGYLILENYDPPFNSPGTEAVNDPQLVSGDPTAAKYRPGNISATFLNGDMTTPPAALGGNANLTGAVVDLPIKNLAALIGPQSSGSGTGYEMVILRPRRADGQYSSCSDPLNSYAEAANNLGDLVPVDSYDFDGFPTLAAVAAVGTTTEFWHYQRPKGAGTVGPPAVASQLFRSTYSSPYTTATSPRQPGPITDTPSITNIVGAPAFVNTASLGTTANPNSWPTFPPIQIYNVGAFVYGTTPPVTYYSHFPNPTVAPNTSGTPQALIASGTKYPFGGFARNGDILDVPFIGAYRITVPSLSQPDQSTSTSSFLELNALPMDCAFADDGDSNDDAVENIGRFCSLAVQPTARQYNPDNYFWTRRVFDYLTAQNNNDNYLPNVDPGFYDITTPAWGPANVTTEYPPATPPSTATEFPAASLQTAPIVTPPTQIYNSDGTLTDQTTQHANGIEGLININTASAQVLNMLPLVPGDTTGLNFKLAQAIVQDRNTNGPFASIYDLNRVTDTVTNNTFQNAEGTLATTSPNSSPSLWPLLSPPPQSFPANTSAARTVAEDYQSDFAELTRISNLITTRSDTFTVYIVVEGWQNAVFPGMSAPNGYPPALKVVHRYSFILDRSAISGATGSITPQTIVVPND